MLKDKTKRVSEVQTAFAFNFVETPTVAKPFLKWAGSKRYLLKHMVGALPPTFNTYREPFLGGGSLFFFLRPETALLSDIDEDLINTYSAIRDNVDSVNN